MAERHGAPRLALRLLEWRLPEEVAEDICGDLEQAHAERIEHGGSRLAADAWVWAQALTVRAGALRRSARRLRARGPTEVGPAMRRRAGASWLDVKLGVRMLKKHPGLTLAAVFALGVGIPIGLAPMHVVGALLRPLPEDEEGRIRILRYWNTRTNNAERPGYFDLSLWRGRLTGFESIGAARGVGYNLVLGESEVVQITGAEVTASVFEMLGTLPLLGRTLDDADERTGAPDVAVIGHDLWQARFAGRPDVVGTTLRTGAIQRTIVGVMPAGFLFPSDGYLYPLGQQLWVPLREEGVAGPDTGPPLLVMGRLSDGVEAVDVEAEASTLLQGLAAEFPDRYGRLRAEVVPFGIGHMALPTGGPGAIPGFFILQLLCLALLLVACANVAMLVFARTATRLRELAIRTALGAGRTRVVSQMFVESLVLAVAAAGVGLIGYRVLIEWLDAYVATSASVESMPYWFHLGLTVEVALWALALAVLSATVVGVLPALRVTGRAIQQSIQRAQAGRFGMRFGGVTGALIVADVAIAVTAVGFALGLGSRLEATAAGRDLVGIPAEEYLTTMVMLRVRDEPLGDAGVTLEEFVPHVASVQRAVLDRLAAEPRVRGATIASDLPRMDHETATIDVEGLSAVEDLGFLERRRRTVNVTRVDTGFFDALDQPVLAGRGFGEADLADDASTVVVNTRFVDRVLEGRNPIGRRIRFFLGGDAYGPWREIVGVVPSLGMNIAMPEYDAGVYLPAAPGEIHPFLLGVHVEGPPETFAPRLHELVSGVDADAVVTQPRTLDQVHPGNWYLFLVTTMSLGLLVAILVAMAASGIYAIMSFAVSERTREIGIRTALGAGRASIVLRIAQRSLVQIGVGALLGIPLAAWLFGLADTGEAGVGMSVGVALAVGVGLVALIGVASCLSPTRRALRIEPTEALRGET
jgi:putative ABC transport system permease protein